MPMAVRLLLASSLLIPLPNAPQALQPPHDQALLLHLIGKGDQLYVCQNNAGAFSWKFKAPDAQLFAENDDPMGRHFAGPTWEAKDGSRVTGKLVASVPSPDAAAIPWLLLTAISNDGAGLLSAVKSIQRLDTKGGLAPSAACSSANENSQLPVPYQANYYFYGAVPR